jgi:hypothetical protein
MNGICIPYVFKMDYPEPNKSGTKGTLKAGYGETVVDFPVGVSMAGYGARSGPKSPYAFNLGSSTGYFDRPLVKAVALDNGLERIIFVRNASSWSTDYINTMMASKLGDTFKENYLNKMISSNAHSHSFPARYWTAAYGTGMGAAGSDDFMWEVFDRLTTSYAKAVELAVNNMVPAKFSYSFDHNFDPTDKVTQARSEETFGVNKDKDLLVMRVDYSGGASDGKTMAVIMRYGSHGTHMGETKMTGDCPGAAEFGSETGFERDLGYHVPVVFLNGNGGNARPQGNTGPGGKGDYLRDDNYLAVQAVGKWVYPMVKARYDAATSFVTAPDMKIVSRFIPLDRKSIGYKDTEFYDMKGEEKVTYWNGAMLCANPYKTEGYTDGALGCVLDVNLLGNGTPFPEIDKLRTSALRIGNLILVALPGEPVNPFGQKIVSQVQTATGVTDIFTIGYSQDHQFYLLNSDDWLKGSYEASMDLWGWKFGDFLADQVIANASTLKDMSTAKDIYSNIKHSWYDTLPKETVTPSVGQNEPAFYEQPAASVTKYDLVTAKFHGGDPGTGGPRIFLETKKGADWVAVETAPGTPYDDTHFHMIVEYPGYDTKDYFKQKFDWNIKWQELHAFKAGTYRFRVEGYKWDGSKAVSYKIYSGEFEVKDITNIGIYGFSRPGSNLTMKLRYPAPPTAGWRLNSEYSPITLGAPLNETKTVKVEASCGAENFSNTAVPVTLSSDKETLTDPTSHNYNVAYTTITIPDFSVKTCDYSITVTDIWGNKGTYTGKIN